MKSWSEAVKMCRKFNADLVSIHGEPEQQWILDNILVPRSLEEIYIGMSLKFIKTFQVWYCYEETGCKFEYFQLVSLYEYMYCL